ncbi:2'-5'-oligoadenylate synthase 1A-like [Psammomys obesus]|uniref:2'-5'-oligoadenylate synthase 1A-like n=1 Tax=Psammomys obesus TaxID=48139 RepID=UPI002453022E|nr:2'-5'-oligoadenylate synthase 1A-like [Psammomys obesus]
MDLSRTPAWELDKFIEDHLLPNTRFRTEVREAINIICAFLKERCFQGAAHRVRVSKVVKGGSSGKGTALRGRSDADLVVFLNNFTSFEDQLRQRAEFIEEIKKQLNKFQYERGVKFEVQNPRGPNSRALSFKLSSPQLQQEVEFDVLPAYDVLGQVNCKPDPQIYARLIRECNSLGKEGEFSTCFTELQRNFLKQRPTKLKSLIRLVKHWYQLCKEKLGKPLPPQYALELLTVYAWERGSLSTDFNTARGFRTVLELVTKYRQLRIYWTVNYDFQHQEVANYLHRQLRRARPVILDPADPTGNIAASNLEGWRRLAGEAAAWLKCPCFKNRDGSPVCPWDVPVRICLSAVPLHTASFSSSACSIASQRPHVPQLQAAARYSANNLTGLGKIIWDFRTVFLELCQTILQKGPSRIVVLFSVVSEMLKLSENLRELSDQLHILQD